jgi:DNA-binding NarL/FixJ family response regulator
MKVLIADGSLMVAGRLLNAMQEIPEVEALAFTRDAQSTLESIRANNPEILIADARIAGAPGFEHLQAIRRQNPDMILIILSNAVYPQSRKHYEAAGADIFMDKSNEFIRLIQFVSELAGSPKVEAGSDPEHGYRERLASGKLKVGLQLILFALSTASRFIGL